jgi:hypothetical protein
MKGNTFSSSVGGRTEYYKKKAATLLKKKRKITASKNLAFNTCESDTGTYGNQ